MCEPPQRISAPPTLRRHTPSPQSRAFDALMTVMGLAEQPCCAAVALPSIATSPRSAAAHQPRRRVRLGLPCAIHKRRALLTQQHRRLLRCAVTGAASGEPASAGTPVRAAEATRQCLAFHFVQRHEHSDESQSVETPPDAGASPSDTCGSQPRALHSPCASSSSLPEAASRQMLAAGLALITCGMPASEVEALAAARAFLSQFSAPAQLALPQQRWRVQAPAAKLGCFPPPAYLGDVMSARRFLASV